MYEYDWNKVKLKFTKNMVIDCNRLKALVIMDPYNSLKANTHKELFGYGGSFMLVIDNWRGDHY